MPKNSRILLKRRFYASNILHSLCNLAVILIIFLAKMDSKILRVNFFHVKNVQAKFQLKIPTLSKNNCSAT